MKLAHCREFFGRKYVAIKTSTGKPISGTVGDIDEVMAEIDRYSDSQGCSDHLFDTREVEQLRVLDQRKTKAGREYPESVARRPFALQCMFAGKFWQTIPGAYYATRKEGNDVKKKRHANNIARVTAV